MIQLWPTDPPTDLAALRIDSPRTRWLAARDYIQELRDDGRRAFERVWLIATFMDYAEANLIARLYASENPLFDTFECSPTDFHEAKRRAIEPYTGAVQRRAAEIIDDFLPHIFKVRASGRR